jgi:hypothetical protein
LNINAFSLIKKTSSICIIILCIPIVEEFLVEDFDASCSTTSIPAALLLVADAPCAQATRTVVPANRDAENFICIYICIYVL